MCELGGSVRLILCQNGCRLIDNVIVRNMVSVVNVYKFVLVFSDIMCVILMSVIIMFSMKILIIVYGWISVVVCSISVVVGCWCLCYCVMSNGVSIDMYISGKNIVVSVISMVVNSMLQLYSVMMVFYSVVVCWLLLLFILVIGKMLVMMQMIRFVNISGSSIESCLFWLWYSLMLQCV